MTERTPKHIRPEKQGFWQRHSKLRRGVGMAALAAASAASWLLYLKIEDKLEKIKPAPTVTNPLTPTQAPTQTNP